MSILYDYPTLTSESVQDQDMHRITQLIVQAAAATTIVEFFPWMIHIPQRSNFCQCLFCIHVLKIDRFSKWEREALKIAAKRSETFLRLFDRVKTDLVRLIIMCIGGWGLDDNFYLTDKRRSPSKFLRHVDRKP